MLLDTLDEDQLKAIEQCEKDYGTNSPSLEELAAVAAPNTPGWAKAVFEDVWLADVASKTN